MHIKSCNTTIEIPNLKIEYTTNYGRYHYSKRKIWEIQPFGLQIDMLLMHLNILSPVIYKFIVSESTYCYRTTIRKDLLLTNAITNNKISNDISSKIIIKNADSERHRCNQNEFSRCFQEKQRHLLLRTVLKLAKSNDLILAADTDEIVRPSILENLRNCNQQFHMLRLIAEYYLYGLHCKSNINWDHGPRLYHMEWLMSKNWSGRSFYNTRFISGNTVPGIKHSAWHFSGFGDIKEIKKKLETFGHADMFARYPITLEENMIEKCVSTCRHLLKSNRPSMCNKYSVQFSVPKNRISNTLPRQILDKQGPPSWYSYLS